MGDSCEGCICLKCRYMPCEDCFSCEIEGYSPSDDCEEYEEDE